MATTSYDSVILATSGLRGYWPLDETTGTAAVDRAAAANNGTLVNTPTLNVAISQMSGGDVGMSFASSSMEAVTIADNAAYDFGTGDYSIEAWIRRTGDPASDEFIVTQGVQGAGGTGFELNFLGGGGSFLQSRINNTTVNSATTSITDGNWHHVVIAMTRAGNGQWYKDGAADGAGTSLAAETATSVNDAGTLYIARRQAGNYWNGGVAKVALYNVALSLATVQAHYAARLLLPAFNAGAAANRRRLRR